MPKSPCPCGHLSTDHSDLAGCLADECLCINTPEQVTILNRPQGLAEGKRLADQGAALAGTGAPGVLASDWRTKAEARLAALIASGSEFSADDLVETVGMPPVANMVGALFRQAAQADRIRAVGFTQSSRPAAHARVQRTWKGEA